MSRSHSIEGLSEKAQKMVKRLKARSTSLVIKGAFGGVVIYRPQEYRNHHGRVVYREFIQDEPWSSGPHTFLALKDRLGQVVKESLWDDEEIDEYI